MTDKTPLDHWIEAMASLKAPGGDGPLGMSLRDYFAGQALCGITTGAEVFWGVAAPLAYQYADAMLAERSKSSKE